MTTTDVEGPDMAPPTPQRSERPGTAVALLVVSRRECMVGAAGLTFGVLLSGCAGSGTMEPRGATLAATAGNAPAFSPWVSIATDGTLFIQSPAVEMGQGSLTSLPLIVAEEPAADWSKGRIVPAPPNAELYRNPRVPALMFNPGS